MSIASAIQNAQGKIANAYTAVSNKGGTLPTTQNLSNLPTAINSIPTNSGSVVVPKMEYIRASSTFFVYYNLLVSGTTAPASFSWGSEPATILNKSNVVTISSGTYTIWEGAGKPGHITDFNLVATITF